MENPNETQKAPAPEAVKADQETLAHSIQEDELQDMLDEKVADTLLNSEMEVETSEEDAPKEAISPEIVQQTIDAEEMQETLDTRVLRDFDEGIISFDHGGIIRYINPAASLILGLTGNAAGKRYRDVFGLGKQRAAVFPCKVYGGKEHLASRRHPVSQGRRRQRAPQYELHLSPG